MLATGQTLLVYEGNFDAEIWYKVMDRYGVTNFTAAPAVYKTVAVAGEDLSGRYRVQARRSTSAGEYLNPEVSRWFDESFGVPISDQYGVSEAGIVVGNHPLSAGKPGSMGKPLLVSR